MAKIKLEINRHGDVELRAKTWTQLGIRQVAAFSKPTEATTGARKVAAEEAVEKLFTEARRIQTAVSEPDRGTP